MGKLHLLILGCLVIAGCSQVPDVIPPTTLEVNNFSDLGEMHNSFLDNAVANLDRIDLDDPELRVKQLRDLNLEHLRNFGFSEYERSQIEDKLLNFSPLFDEREVADRSFYRKGMMVNGKVDPTRANIPESLENLRLSGKIGTVSYGILSKLTDDVKLSYEGALSNEEVKSHVLTYIREFNDQDFPKGSQEGELVGSILAISQHSIEWWEHYPDMGEYREDGSGNVVYLAPWVGVDIAGAIIGGVSSAMLQEGITGDVNWYVVGGSALVGAGTASTGLVGRFGKLINKRF